MGALIRGGSRCFSNTEEELWPALEQGKGWGVLREDFLREVTSDLTKYGERLYTIRTPTEPWTSYVKQKLYTMGKLLNFIFFNYHMVFNLFDKHLYVISSQSLTYMCDNMLNSIISDVIKRLLLSFPTVSRILNSMWGASPCPQKKPRQCLNFEAQSKVIERPRVPSSHKHCLNSENQMSRTM